MTGSNITTPAPILEWGAKARKIEAKSKRSTHRAAAIRDAKDNG